MKSEYFKDLHIASIESGSSDNEIKVNTLLQNIDAKQPSINAFLGARYSRSSDSVVLIAKEVYESGKDAAKRLESIFYNYGHKSVGDMADIFLCLENIPIFLAQRFFYLNPVHAGQERSTRYQDFSNPKFVKLPSSIKTSKYLREEYDSIILSALQNYQDLKAKTEGYFVDYFGQPKNQNESGALKARVFDTIRYFIPIGLHTSIGVVTSARVWAERISYYRASKFSLERALGNLIYELLIGNDELKKSGYIPEADGLIRHTDADYSRRNSSEEIIKKIKIKSQFKEIRDLEILKNLDPAKELVDNYLLLFDPTRSMDLSAFQLGKLKTMISKVISKYHDHHHQLGNIAQSGSYLITGHTDYGVLKDLIRHRSLEKFIPFFEEEADFTKEMEREPEQMFKLCNYLNITKFSKLRNEYEQKMTQYYTRVKDWFKRAENELSKDYLYEFSRYLFTHGYNARYKFYGSFDDLFYTISLRTRNGGHIAYRKLTRDWLSALSKQDILWESLDQKLPGVDKGDRVQFYDRS